MSIKVDPSFRNNQFPDVKPNDNAGNEIKLSRKGEIIQQLRKLRDEFVRRLKDERSQLDIVFKREFFDKFTKILDDYTNGSFLDDSSVFNQQKIIQEVLSSDVKKGLIEQIEQLTSDVISKIKKISITTSKKLDIGDIIRNKDFTDKLNINKNKVKDIIDQVYDSTSSKPVTDFKNNLSDTIKNSIDRINDAFFKTLDGILPKQLENKDLETLMNGSVFNPMEPIEDSFKIKLDIFSKKRADKLVDQLYFKIAYNALNGAFVIVGRMFKNIYLDSKKIVSAVTSVVSSLIKGVAGIIDLLLIKPIQNLIIKPLFKLFFTTISTVILKPLKIVGSMLSSIFGNLKDFSGKNTLQVLLFNPIGMYMLGFVTRLIWDRVENIFKKGNDSKFSLRGFINNIINTVFPNIINWIYEKIHEINDYLHMKFPLFMTLVDWGIDFIKWVLSPIIDFAYNLVTGEYGGVGEIFETVIDKIGGLFNNKLVKNIISLSVKICDFIIKHPVLTVVIYESLRALKNINKIRKIISVSSDIFARSRNIGFWGALMNAALGYGSATIVETIFDKFFQSRDDENYKITNGEISDLRNEITSVDMSRFGYLDAANRKKAEDIQQSILYETGDLQKYTIWLGDLGKSYKEDKDQKLSYKGKIIRDTILSFPWAKPYRNDVLDKSGGYEQIVALQKIVRGRVDDLLVFSETLNRTTNQNLLRTDDSGKNVLDMIDDGLKSVGNQYSFRKFAYIEDGDIPLQILGIFNSDRSKRVGKYSEAIHDMPPAYNSAYWGRDRQSYINRFNDFLKNNKVSNTIFDESLFESREERDKYFIRLMESASEDRLDNIIDSMLNGRILAAQQEFVYLQNELGDSRKKFAGGLSARLFEILQNDTKQIISNIDSKIKELIETNKIDTDDYIFNEYIKKSEEQSEKTINELKNQYAWSDVS